jgi:hypothetical protein
MPSPQSHGHNQLRFSEKTTRRIWGAIAIAGLVAMAALEVFGPPPAKPADIARAARNTPFASMPHGPL